MKKSYYIASVLALASFFGCQDDMEVMNNSLNESTTEITATIENNVETRTQLDGTENNGVFWSTGDKLSVFLGNTTNKEFILESGQGTGNATFKGSGDVSINAGTETNPSTLANVAYYPYSSDVSLDATNGYKITASFPGTQNYVVNSFGQGAAPMVAVTQDNYDNAFKFKNVGSIFKFELKEGSEAKLIKKVTLSSVKNKLAGKYIVTASNVGEPTFEFADEAVRTITLDCGDSGVKLIGITTFVFALPYQKYEVGDLTFTFYTTDGEYMTYATTKEYDVERSKSYIIKGIQYVKTGVGVPAKVWDGSTLVQPADKDASASKVLYEVNNAEELAWVLRNWNGGSTSPTRPTTISLMNDIDFGGHEIYFDMTEVGGFHSVTLEGNNYTIKNYKVAGVNKRAGLFPQGSGVTIKDLIIDNAVVGSEQTSLDLYSGALMGIATDQKPNPYTTVITNVTVQNSTIKGVNKVGGLVGQANGIHVVSNTDVKNTTIAGYGSDAGCLGGLYGYLKVEGESSFTNSRMIGGSIVCAEGADTADRGSSGFIGSLHMGMASSSLVLTSCEVSSTTDITQSNTTNPLNKFVGTIRTGTAATLTIDGVNISY